MTAISCVIKIEVINGKAPSADPGFLHVNRCKTGFQSIVWDAVTSTCITRHVGICPSPACPTIRTLEKLDTLEKRAKIGRFTAPEHFTGEHHPTVGIIKEVQLATTKWSDI